MNNINVAEVKFWFMNGDFAGVAVLGEGDDAGIYFCYSRSDIFLGTAKHLLECRRLIIGD